MDKKERLDVRVYYQSLSRGERRQLLHYLMIRHAYNPRTMSAKLIHSGCRFRRDELENIEEAIRLGVWRA